MRTHALLSLGAAALFCAGCDTHLFSPPARTAPLESAATLPDGDYGVQGELAAHGGGIWGPSLTSGTARVRRGFGDSTDLSLEATVLHEGDPGSVPTNRNAYAGRFGVKEQLAPWVALTAGLGGGGSAAGGFFSPDMGIIFAYENRYFVPFLSGRLSFSQPFARRAVAITPATSDSAGVIDTPMLTWIESATLGFRIPMPSGSHEDRGEVRAALLAGLTLSSLDDGEQETFVSGTLGLELMF